MPNGLREVGRTFFNLHQIGHLFPTLLEVGLLNTLLLSAGAIVLGMVLGMIIALGLIARSPVLRTPARIYVDVFRGLPIILTIYLVGQGLPIAGIRFLGSSAYPYAILALGLVAAAFISEVFRSGIESVERGQLEAARGLGLSYLAAMRLVVVPQGVRRVLPALANQFVAMVKDSSLVYLLGLSIGQRELFSIAQDATAQTGNLSPMVAAGIIYLAITVPLTHLVNRLDRRLREGRPADVTRGDREEPARQLGPVNLSVSGE